MGNRQKEKRRRDHRERSILQVGGNLERTLNVPGRGEGVDLAKKQRNNDYGSCNVKNMGGKQRNNSTLLEDCSANKNVGRT